MSGRVVVHHDLLLAALRGGPADPDALAARAALRAGVESGIELLLPAAAWPALLDGLRGAGWSAAEIAEALHALDGLDLRTVDTDQPTNLLVAEAMERHGLDAADAAAVVLGVTAGAAVATLSPAIQAARSAASDVRGDEPTDAGATTPPRGRSLADYRGLGAFLGELRRRAGAA